MNYEDYEQLAIFVRNFHAILTHGEIGAFLPENHRHRFEAALDDLEPYFSRLSWKIDARRRPKKLYQAGLWGHQLDFKLGVFNEEHQQVMRMCTRETVIRGLDAGIIIMESIGKAFPLGEAITETAKVAKHVLENGEV